MKVSNLSKCNLIEGGIPSEIYHLSSLQALYLDGNHFSSIPAGINLLSELRVLNLNHCQKLLQIPELPSSLRFLDIHSCTSLETLTSPSSLVPSCLFKCFKSTIQVMIFMAFNHFFFLCPDMRFTLYFRARFWTWYCYSNRVLCLGSSCSNHQLRICVSSSGNPGWISYDQNEGSKVSRKLPLNWYKNNDLLGFALCSVHVPPDKESEDGLDDDGTWSLKCELTIEDGHQFKVVVPLSFQCWCVCDIDDDVSSQVWVTYYPKITFPSKYASNKRRAFLKAAFQGYFNGEPVKVENCGIHLIYAHEQEPSRWATPWSHQARSPIKLASNN